MEELTKNQHYVPQFLLNNWAIKEHIWALKKENNETIHPNIDGVCSKRYLYDIKSPLSGELITQNKYEKRFAKYESFISIFLKDYLNKLDNNSINNLIIDSSEFEILLRFAISLCIRNIRNVNFLVENIKITENEAESIKIFCKSLNHFLLSVFNDNRKITEEQMKEMINKLDTFELITPEIRLNNTFNYGPLNDFIYKDFNNSYVYILKNENNSFFTNDIFSVFLDTPISKQIYLPLSPEYCFICSMHKINEWNENKINVVNDDYCYEIINNISMECNFIFSNSEDKIEKFKKYF